MDENIAHPGFFSSRSRHLNMSSTGHDNSNGSDTLGGSSTNRSSISQNNNRKKDIPDVESGNSIELYISSPNRLYFHPSPIPNGNAKRQDDLPECIISQPVNSMYYSGDINVDVGSDDGNSDGNTDIRNVHEAARHWIKGMLYYQSLILIYAFISLYSLG